MGVTQTTSRYQSLYKINIGKSSLKHNKLPLHTYEDGYNKKTDNNRHWRVCGETETHLYHSWECKMVQLHWKAVFQFLKWL